MGVAGMFQAQERGKTPYTHMASSVAAAPKPNPQCPEERGVDTLVSVLYAQCDEHGMLLEHHARAVSKAVQVLLDSQQVQLRQKAQGMGISYEQFVAETREAAYFHHGMEPSYSADGKPNNQLTRQELKTVCRLPEAPRLVEEMVQGIYQIDTPEFFTHLAVDPRPGYLVIAEDIVRLEGTTTHEDEFRHLYQDGARRYIAQATRHLSVAALLGVQAYLITALQDAAAAYPTSAIPRNKRRLTVMFSALLHNVGESVRSAAALL